MTTVDTSSHAVSASQRRLALLHHLRPHDPGANVVVMSDLGEGLDPERLAAAIRRVLRHTPSFNETFLLDHTGSLVRQINPDPNHEVPVNRYTTVDQFRDEATRLVDIPFDPSQWPLSHFEIGTVGPRSYLLTVASHIVSDGFGFYLLLRDFIEAYEKGERWSPARHLSPADLTEPAIDTAAAVEHFRSVLPQETLAVTAWDASADTYGRIAGRTSRWTIAADTALAAASAKDELGVRRFSHLLSTYMVVLHGITGDDHLVASVPFSNRRSSEEHAQSRGVLVNPLPVAVRISDHRTYADLCREIDRQVNALMAIESIDFGMCRSQIAITGSAAPSASFTYYPTPLTPTIAGHQSKPVTIDRKFLQYPLAIAAEMQSGALALIIEQSDVLGDISVGELYETVLRQTSNNPNVLLTELVWCEPGAASEASLAPRVSTSDHITIDEQWMNIVRQNPGRVALECDETTLTYEQLHHAATERARAIVATTPADLVGIAIAPSPELIVSILAVLLAGKAYVPLDVAAPTQRVKTIVDTCNTLDVLVLDESPWALPSLTAHSLTDLLNGKRDDIVLPEVTTEDLAYVIFTSGSTGRPKGVSIDHRAVTRLIETTATDLDLTGKRWTLYHSYAFDFSVWEIFGALLNAGTLVIPDAHTREDPHRFLEFLAREEITVLNQTPSAFSMLMSSATDPQIRSLSIETVIFGGEALYFDQLKKFLRLRGTGTRLVNMYGITETTVHATWFVVDPERLHDPRSIIGVPLNDLGITVVDTHHRPVPVGVIGEIAVYGPGVTRGYLGQPELTAEKITTVAGRPRSYLSGDLAYLNRDRQLVYIGRRDKQVQLRGHRIELGEVEWALRQLPSVEHAAAITVGTGFETELIGFVVTSDDSVDEQKMLHEMAKLVPTYMIPARLIRLDAIPMTINGKIDRDCLESEARLTHPEPEVRHEIIGYPQARESVRRAWESALESSDFDDNTRFFDAGGTSQLVVAILHRLRQELDFPDLDVVDLFEHTTIHALSTYIATEKAAH
ncbi:non-ribosomal peptide synthetase [Rhodococcus erythropolis]|uniref:non-ribosomal peptide synthetase n=1 Tax=Rhodococcus erythropolis TaxID=1833 RepID=UPI001BEAF39A|nr:non-ribosomal peptide synthetase [Rhodococcus erythropolis]MBT2263387.1 amino acid adenylation domain-containing protein [Rhodococcus erythropolis]